MIQTISHVDEKVLHPTDISKVISKEELDKHYNKPTRGYAIISDSDGNVLESS